MSLDIKYRPRTYDDVLGQEATIKVMRRFVSRGQGYRQSYLLCGAHGSGKTTLGRILARALLCDAPVDGAPCDECPSCRSFLEKGTSPDFVEVDAATHSGKGDVTRITDEIQYNTFSGKRRIYLFDEAHQLSKDALDALLKPLEDTLPGSEDKQLVCIFCTTEPEKMRATVLSRCAPAFVIRPQTPADIATRLAYICEQEGIEADREMLELIAEITECHIRDALKAVEGVSMLGEVTKETVTSYLHLDLNTGYIDLIEALGVDLSKAMETAKLLMQRASPLTCYEKLVEVSMLAYRAMLGEVIPAYWSRERLIGLGASKREALLGYAARFASRPGRPTAAMLMLDLAHLHHHGGDVRQPLAVMEVRGAAPALVAAPAPAPRAPAPRAPAPAAPPPSVKPAKVPDQDRAWVDARHGKAARKANTPEESPTTAPDRVLMKPREFGDMLSRTLLELSSGRPPG